MGFFCNSKYARTNILDYILLISLRKQEVESLQGKVKFIIATNNYFLKDVKIYAMKMRQKVKKENGTKKH